MHRRRFGCCIADVYILRMLTHSPERQLRSQASSNGGVTPIQLPRSSGLLLHVSSLPGPYGIGDLGRDAYRFADHLDDAGQHIWQVLPLVPVGLGYSPYSSPSTFAGNPLFISPAKLAETHLLDGAPDPPGFPGDRVDFPAVIEFKESLLLRAFGRFESGAGKVDRAAYRRFCTDHAYWLDDYALFMAMKGAFGAAPWTEWPAALARRETDAVNDFSTEHARTIERHKFQQFIFFSQWNELRSYCNDRSISLFGDLPIYVAHDSADVWAHRDLFFLDENGHSTVVAGVPPDYFSETGQRWGNPIYRWDRMQENEYWWWKRRFAHTFQMVDLIRLDHFRAFAGYWEIPATQETAIHGRWVEGPGASLFRSIEDRLGPLPLVAENLGLITPDVTELMNAFAFPGMAVLQFAFGESSDHPFLPHNLPRNVVAYTGTHDNDTIEGWWQHITRDPEQRRTARFAQKYLPIQSADGALHWAAIRAMMASPADYVVVPMQDLFGLGSEARMNTPGRGEGNWTWRLQWERLTPDVLRRLKMLTAIHGRSDRLDEVL